MTFLDEDAGAGDLHVLAERVRTELDRYVGIVGAEPLPWPDDPAEFSYAVGEAVGLDLGERQELLAVADTASRLRRAGELVRREVGLAQWLGVGAGPQPLDVNLN